MSRIAGPTGLSELGNAERTPGTLGVNDLAAGALAGNGRNAPKRRTAKSEAWTNFLDSVCDWNNVAVPGPQIAWNSTGHWDMTKDVVSDAESDGDFLPPKTSLVRYRLMSILQSLPFNVVMTDVTIEQYSDTRLGHIFLAQTGQATHFMANKGQSQLGAYQAGIKKAFGPVFEALEIFKSSLAGSLDPFDSRIGILLGNGVHALQDSFSPVHVKREKRGDKWIIMQIYVWSEEDKKDHEAGDEMWRNQNGSLSDLGRACEEATKMLLTYFVFHAIGRWADGDKVYDQLMDKFLQAGPNIVTPQ